MSIRYYYKVVAGIEFYIAGETVDDVEESAKRMIDDFVGDDGNSIAVFAQYDQKKTDEENG